MARLTMPLWVKPTHKVTLNATFLLLLTTPYYSYLTGDPERHLLGDAATTYYYLTTLTTGDPQRHLLGDALALRGDILRHGIRRGRRPSNL
eukprot:scaffold45114_cov40-Phaeocystis_antarctica.AAC.1